MARRKPPETYVPRAMHFAAWRELRGLTQEEVGALMGYDRSTATRIEARGSRYEQPTLELYADAVGCEPADLFYPPPGVSHLLRDAPRGTADALQIRIAGAVGAGDDADAIQQGDQSSFAADIARAREVAALRIVGSSMEPGYRDGDLEFYDMEPRPFGEFADGDTAVVQDFDGLRQIKIIRRRAAGDNGAWTLASLNKTTKPRHNVQLTAAWRIAGVLRRKG